jgi:hypothetical protein
MVDRTNQEASTNLLSDIDAELLEAASEVDRTLIEWLLSLPPLERISWAARTAESIKGFKRVDK